MKLAVNKKMRRMWGAYEIKTAAFDLAVKRKSCSTGELSIIER